MQISRSVPLSMSTSLQCVLFNQTLNGKIEEDVLTFSQFLHCSAKSKPLHSACTFDLAGIHILTQFSINSLDVQTKKKFISKLFILSRFAKEIVATDHFIHLFLVYEFSIPCTNRNGIFQQRNNFMRTIFWGKKITAYIFREKKKNQHLLYDMLKVMSFKVVNQLSNGSFNLDASKAPKGIITTRETKVTTKTFKVLPRAIKKIQIHIGDQTLHCWKFCEAEQNVQGICLYLLMYKLQNLQIFQKYRESRDFCDWGVNSKVKKYKFEKQGSKVVRRIKL